MNQVVADLVRLVSWGAGTSWFGLICPAHCGASGPFLFAFFLAGFCLGALCTVALAFWAFYSAFLNPSSRPAQRPATPSSIRLAYLHERDRSWHSD